MSEQSGATDNSLGCIMPMIFVHSSPMLSGVLRRYSLQERKGNDSAIDRRQQREQRQATKQALRDRETDLRLRRSKTGSRSLPDCMNGLLLQNTQRRGADTNEIHSQGKMRWKCKSGGDES